MIRGLAWINTVVSVSRINRPHDAALLFQSLWLANVMQFHCLSITCMTLYPPFQVYISWRWHCHPTACHKSLFWTAVLRDVIPAFSFPKPASHSVIAFTELKRNRYTVSRLHFSFKRPERPFYCGLITSIRLFVVSMLATTKCFYVLRRVSQAPQPPILDLPLQAPSVYIFYLFHSFHLFCGFGFVKGGHSNTSTRDHRVLRDIKRFSCFVAVMT